MTAPEKLVNEGKPGKPVARARSVADIAIMPGTSEWTMHLILGSTAPLEPPEIKAHQPVRMALGSLIRGSIRWLVNP